MNLFLTIFFMITFVTFANSQPCDDSASIDITLGTKYHDGSVIFHDINFPENLVFKKNVSGEFRTFGCLCEIRKCFRKCCELGSVLDVDTKTCVRNETQDKLLGGLDLYYMDAYIKTVNLEKSFSLMYGWPCQPPNVYLEDAKWFVQEDGKLYIEVPNSIPPWITRPNDKYCIDTFVYEADDGTKTTKLDALVCSAEDSYDHTNILISSTCMLISCVFILATVGVYLWLPELRNLHGRVLITYLLCLFVGFLSLATMQALLIANNITPDACLALTFFIYFFLLSAFFWMNVMSFDIWWTFSGKRGLSLEKLSMRGRFCAYASYAFGVPTLLTVTLISLEFSGLPAHPLLPNIKQQGCFLFGKSKLLYLYGPIVLLCIANLVFFILTALKIALIKKQTSVLKSKESSTHDQHRKEKQRLTLYIKLFIVMGINWILEVISALYPQHFHVWRYTDAYNVLIGLIIFIIFVCKRKIFRLMKKRYMQLRGDPMSRTQTASSRTMSSRDDIRMSSVKNNN